MEMLTSGEHAADHKGRCLEHVHRVTTFASNYDDENGWKYTVSICMENSFGRSGGPGRARLATVIPEPGVAAGGSPGELRTHVFAEPEQ